MRQVRVIDAPSQLELFGHLVHKMPAGLIDNQPINERNRKLVRCFSGRDEPTPREKQPLQLLVDIKLIPKRQSRADIRDDGYTFPLIRELKFSKYFPHRGIWLWLKPVRFDSRNDHQRAVMLEYGHRAQFSRFCAQVYSAQLSVGNPSIDESGKKNQVLSNQRQFVIQRQFLVGLVLILVGCALIKWTARWASPGGKPLSMTASNLVASSAFFDD
jgi:hypothetical protein